MPALIAATWLWSESIALSVGAPLNFLVNVAGALAVVYAIIKVGKSKVKDDTIKDLQNSIEAKDGRLRDLSEEVKNARQQTRQIEQAAHHSKTEAEVWRGKYQEAKEYTAEEAVKHFEIALESHSGRVAGVHEVLIQQGQQNTKALGEIASALSHIEQRLNGKG